MSSVIYDTSIAPYYNTTENEVTEGYDSVLFKEGNRLQTRELNVLQGLVANKFRKVNDVIMESGAIISGCGFSNDTTNMTCSVAKGQIYLNGMVVDIPETIWTYTDDTDLVSQIPLGKVIIYALILPVVVTAVDDNELYNPAQNYESFGDTGADRLKYIAKVYNANEEEYTEIAKENKNIVKLLIVTDRDNAVKAKAEEVWGEISKEMQIRTYDQSGDFIASGLSVKALRNENNPEETYTIRVSSGRCYVRGQKFDFTDKTISYPNASISVDSTLSTGIPEKVQYTGSSKKYYLSHKAVKKIINIIGPKSITATLQRASSGTTDTITLSAPYDSSQIVGVSEVRTTDGSTIFVKRDSYTTKYDYDNTTGSKIIWNTSGPNGSIVKNLTSYTADVVYDTLLDASEYKLFSDKDGSYLTFTATQNLVENYNFAVNYIWYMSRIDLVYVSMDGIISVKSGSATDTGTLNEPIAPNGCLQLANITVEPNKEPQYFSVKQYGLYRVPIAKLHAMEKRISNLEYNATMTALENQLQNKYTSQGNSDVQESVYNLKNIFTDPLADYTKADITNKSFDATINVFKNYVVLPIITDQIGYDKVRIRKINNKNQKVEINPNTDNVQTCNRTTVLNDDGVYEDSKILSSSQLHATNEMDIAPYISKILNPTITCEPNKFTDVEDDPETRYEWLPTKITYSRSYVDTLVNTVKNYTGTTIVTYTTTTN